MVKKTMRWALYPTAMSFSMVVRMKTSPIMRRELARLVNSAVKWDTPRVNNKREEMMI